MVQFIMAILRTTFVPPWTRSEPWAGISYWSFLYAFAGVWSWTGTILEQWCEVLVFKLNCFHDYFIWTWFVITLNHTLMYDVVFVNWCNMWHVSSIMYNLGCMLTVNRDHSWYSMDYRVYMGSSMIAWPLVGSHCICALINWTVLL